MRSHDHLRPLLISLTILLLALAGCSSEDGSGGTGGAVPDSGGWTTSDVATPDGGTTSVDVAVDTGTEPEPCVPSCEGKNCGDDGCGGVCGICDAGTLCSTTSECVDAASCTDTCESVGAACGIVCGIDCGGCGAGEACSDYQCECAPSCQNKTCGDDGCGGSCGECADGDLCDGNGICTASSDCTDTCAAAGATCGTVCGESCGVCADNETCQGNACICVPSCVGKACGDDGCGGSCGACDEGFECMPDNTCGCMPSCEGKVCGDDGCGGSCGDCADGATCNEGGQCDACVPSCVGMECGDDGCGGSCGDCGENGTCTDGVCDCTADCTDKACGNDGCGGSCGDCDAGSFCNSAGDCICAPDCVGKPCGDDGCGGSCGDCVDGLVCSATGQCAVPYEEGALGAYCGPSETCAAQIMDPVTGLMIDNASWPDCLNLACDSGFCTGAGLPGVFVLTAAACSQSCAITVDGMNNSTGLPGADGIEDPDAPSDCTDFVDGPMGSQWRCVNFGTPGTPGNSFCMPGTTFEVCGKDGDCPDGEGCDLTTFGGLGQRCFTQSQTGGWGDAVPMTTQCNDDPYGGEIGLCEQGLCYTMLGCSSFCETSLDCDTTQIYQGSGCNQESNTCEGWHSKNCLSDADCSAWFCNEPAQIFSNVPEYTPQLCFPNVCDTVDDCPADFYCRWFFNGQQKELAGWEHRCLARDAEGVGLGEPCDPDPTDNIPGDVCQASDLCVGGYCSAICSEDSQCGPEQVCRTEEANLDTIGDGLADTMLPLEYCITLPGKDGPCLAEATCTDAQKCGIYETHVPGDEDTLTVAGYCHDTDPTLGALGQSCGAVGADADQCENFCLGANSAAGIAGLCTQTCETHTDCPAAEVDGATYSFRCQTYVYSYGFDEVATEDNIYIGLCVPNSVGSSGEDCSADFTCASETEACSLLSVNFGPDYPAGTDYICLDTTANGAFLPSKELGEDCDPNAPFDQCKTMYCLTNPTGTSGVCSAPCDPENDQCGDGLFCEADIAFPRAGDYEANAGVLWRCNTDPNWVDPGECTPACDGLACGEDGCGGTCGVCPDGESCEAGACVAAATTVDVDIVGFAFVPADIEVTIGTTVVWTNSDADQHSVKSRAEDGSVDAGGPLDGPLLAQDETFEYTFDVTGVYDYRCGPHSSMQGTVTVTAAE